eukprot:GFYU01009077.1.p1 GENE.GFYU01009077.1~~GFYU01009077.1.p1  ORF type:complete len:180 (+),score=25.30 GFYU01009077.1:123-662(+)
MGGSPSRILPGLYHGGADVLDDEDWFAEERITHVLSLGNATPGVSKPLVRKQVNVPDTEEANLYLHMDDIVQFIHDCRVNGGVCYVHCSAGISRSSTAVVAYLMAHLRMSFSRALEVVQILRSTAQPNAAFQKQLVMFGEEKADNLFERMSEHPQTAGMRLRDKQALDSIDYSALEQQG